MKSNKFWVECREPGGKEYIVCHSKDDETGELYHLFLTRAKASKLLEAEKKLTPHNKYRVVREVRQMFQTKWE
jgi:hypothetical protein